MSATQVLTSFGLDPALPRDDGVLESVTLSHNFVIEFSNFYNPGEGRDPSAYAKAMA